jgi:hypothetical protein
MTAEECKFSSNLFEKYVYPVRIYLLILVNKEDTTVR